jgi:hypothetical protein
MQPAAHRSSPSCLVIAKPGASAGDQKGASHGLYRITARPGGFINSSSMNTPDARALWVLSLARSSLSEQKPVHIKSFSLTSARAKSLRSAPSVVSGGTPGQGESERESARSRRQGQLWNDERMCTNTVSILICLFVAAPHSLSVSAARIQYKKQPSHLPAFEAAAV